MEFFEAVQRRRSVRKYTERSVPEEVMQKALDAALLAPNSSNMQSWEFHWVRSAEKKKALIEACLNQSAARTARELVVIVATTRHWKRNSKAIATQLRSTGADSKVLAYYEKLMPFVYGNAGLAPLKWMLFNITGLFRPMTRHPWSGRDVQEVAIKSAALGAENFMLAIAAQGFDTCPMEGLDEARVSRLLGLSRGERVVMTLSVGERDPEGIWGEQFRLPREWFVKIR